MFSHVQAGKIPWDIQIRWLDVRLPNLCTQIPAWWMSPDGSAEVTYGKCGPYFNHFIGMDNIHAQPASRSVWRQGCAQPTTATTVPGGTPQSPQIQETVCKHWLGPEGWKGHSRESSESGKSKKWHKQDLLILSSLLHLVSRKKLNSVKETTEGFSHPPVAIYTTQEHYRQ